MQLNNYPSCDVEPLTAYAVETHRLLFGNFTHIELQLSSDPIPLCAISQQALHRCLSNLLMDAQRIATTSGKITITVTNEQSPKTNFCSFCKEQLRGDFVCISVTAANHNVKACGESNIFEPIPIPKKIESEFNLSMTQHLVHQYSGHVESLSNSIGKSTVSIYIPVIERLY